MEATQNRLKTPNWLNKEFLQTVIKQKHDTLVDISEYTLKKTLGRGDSYLSTMLRVSVRFTCRDREDTPEEIHLILKLLPEGEHLCKLVSGSSIFPNEIRMYTETVPKICELFRKLESTFDMAANFYYHREVSPVALVIEDLSEKGFKMADRKKGLDLDHCLLVMRCLAKFHAASVILHSQDPDSVEVYESNFVSEKPSDVFFNHFISTGLTALADVVEKVLPDHPDYPHRLRRRISTLREDQRTSFFPDTGGFNVLIHGDLWINNILFRYGDDGMVQQAKFIDFQFCCYASPAVDLQYFIHTSPTEDVRVHHTETLLKTYHSEFGNTATLLGYRGEIPSFPQLISEYERKTVFGFFTTAVVLPTFLADDNDDFSIDSCIREDDLTRGHMKRLNNPLFIPVLKRLLPEFAHKGAF